MNTKIQILNSIDLENISGGMNQDNFLGGLTTPFGFRMEKCKSDSEVFKEFKDKGFIEGLKSLYGDSFSESYSKAYLGDFSGIFSGEKISKRAGALTAFGIVCVTVTGTVVGAYKGIKWVAKKIF